MTVDPLSTSPSLPAHTQQDTSSTAHASESWTRSSAQPTTTGRPVTSAPGRGAAGQTYQEVPSELNVGDEGKAMSSHSCCSLQMCQYFGSQDCAFVCHSDLKGPRSSSPLDPLLAGLLSVFIVTTAIVFVILFLKFRQRTNHPEFHRLQDLPMVR